MIYLASPYSDPNPQVRQMRFVYVCEAAAALMARGHHIFSPIAHTHPIKTAGDLGGGWDDWSRYDKWFIRHCEDLWVLCLPGWKDSKGVTAEIAFAKSLGRIARYLDPVALYPGGIPSQEPPEVEPMGDDELDAWRVL